MKILGVAITLADTIAPFSTTTPEVSIHFWATTYSVSYVEMYNVIKCESGFDSDALGDKGTSIGIAQIHLPAHSDITKEEALDPDFSIRWMAEQFAKGKADIWTCHRQLDLAHITAPLI